MPNYMEPRRRRPIDDLLDPGFLPGDGDYQQRPRRHRPVPFLPPTTVVPATPATTTAATTPATATEEESPWVNPFMEVYETTEAGAMERLRKMQDEMAKRFAHRGGYFGGRHAISQAEMAEETGRSLDQLLAQVSLGATEQQYEDWLRGRQEMMSLVSLIPALLGTQTTTPIVEMPQQGAGGLLGNLLGFGAGSFLGPMGGAAGAEIGGRIK